jgi:predicted transcriptional regulator
VPPDALREAFQTAVQAAQAAGYAEWLAAAEAALDYLATRIASKFGVSAEVIARRLRVEKTVAAKLTGTCCRVGRMGLQFAVHQP